MSCSGDFVLWRYFLFLHFLINSAFLIVYQIVNVAGSLSLWLHEVADEMKISPPLLALTDVSFPQRKVIYCNNEHALSCVFWVEGCTYSF